ncbi:MAG: helix-turn-helix domain-containing protein [Ignavibacteria bacterium]|nr:helix-turn-helix domain-containing protein [Ignavibacteria bacterium]
MKRQIFLGSQLLELVEKDWRRITVKELAAQIQRDPSDISRLFRKSTGKTIRQFINERRRQHLLDAITSSVDSRGYHFAEQLGFLEERSFYRWVKKEFGVSFEELRNEHRACGAKSKAKRKNQSIPHDR